MAGRGWFCGTFYSSEFPVTVEVVVVVAVATSVHASLARVRSLKAFLVCFLRGLVVGEVVGSSRAAARSLLCRPWIVSAAYPGCRGFRFFFPCIIEMLLNTSFFFHVTHIFCFALFSPASSPFRNSAPGVRIVAGAPPPSPPTVRAFLFCYDPAITEDMENIVFRL